MRIWLNPELMTARNLAAGEVVEALRANNLQIAPGALNQQPVPTSGAFQLSVETVGRLLDPQQFADIVVKRSEEHTSELQSLMRHSYAVFCLKKQKHIQHQRIANNR